MEQLPEKIFSSNEKNINNISDREDIYLGGQVASRPEQEPIPPSTKTPQKKLKGYCNVSKYKGHMGQDWFGPKAQTPNRTKLIRQ